MCTSDGVLGCAQQVCRLGITAGTFLISTLLPLGAGTLCIGSDVAALNRKAINTDSAALTLALGMVVWGEGESRDTGFTVSFLPVTVTVPY